jgi:microcystin-dependent protein
MADKTTFRFGTTPVQSYATAAEILAGSEAAKAIAPDQLAASYKNVPVGAVLAFPVGTVPAGYLECNGAAISKTTYATLYAFLKDSGASCIYGESTTFNLPDYRGRFMRGWDHGVARDPDKATRTNRGDTQGGDYVGTLQAESYLSHAHSGIGGAFWLTGSGGNALTQSGGSTDVYQANTASSGGNETRPLNINVMYCIKY